MTTTPDPTGTASHPQEAWWPYAFDLPPAPMDQPPCDANRGHGASVPWVLQRLSCMAREHQAMHLMGSDVDHMGLWGDWVGSSSLGLLDWVDHYSDVAVKSTSHTSFQSIRQMA